MQLSTLKDLGKSLADVAAFMHEVEVEQGFVYRPHDGRGIERIRHLAYRLESFQTDLKVGHRLRDFMLWVLTVGNQRRK